MRHPCFPIHAALLVLGLAGHGHSQCGLAWQPNLGFAGTAGPVFASQLWDPDGTGPQAPVLVVGGSFHAAGNVTAHNVAMFDFTTGVWSPLGEGLNTSVSAFAVLPNGDLVAGGQFSASGFQELPCVARWDGASWHAIGRRLSGDALTPNVLALAVLPNGDLAAAGSFAKVDGARARNVARWNGVSWQPIGGGIGGPSDVVCALTVAPNGDLVAGGSFAVAGGTAASNLARWNGANWSSVGGGTNSRVNAVLARPNGEIVVGGYFTIAGGASVAHVATWNGAGWSALGAGTSGSVSAIAALPNGDLAIGGSFVAAGGIGVGRIARWDGSSWSTFTLGVGGQSPYVTTLAVLPGGDLIAGGGFTLAGGGGAQCVARWN